MRARIHAGTHPFLVSRMCKIEAIVQNICAQGARQTPCGKQASFVSSSTKLTMPDRHTCRAHVHLLYT